VASSSLTVARVMQKLGQILEDLEAQPTAEGATRARAHALLQQAAAMPVALLIANNSGRYIDVNDHATRLTGYSRAELLRMSVWDLTPKPSVVAGRRLWREFLAVERMNGRYSLRQKDGSEVRADFRAWANVLPGLHVSALATPALIRAQQPAGRSRGR
jgi:PAS domain S-box-containing protein